ncbi:MAG: YggT family protein [Dehalococcoidia bacterium]
MTTLVQIVQLFVNVLIFAIFARSILTWFPIDRGGPVFQALDAITEPILQPLRRIVPLIGMIDITPMVAIFLLYAISYALGQSLSGQ